MSDSNDPQIRSIRQRFELKDRNYIVTGGAMGIGFAVVAGIAEMGGNVVIIDLEPNCPEYVQTLQKQFLVKMDYFSADVSDEKSLKSAFDEAMKTLGSLDGIVTAAGIALDKPFVKQGWDEVNKVLQINQMGSFFAAQMAVEQMQKQGTSGSVVLIASITAHVNIPGYQMAGYNMSKGGIKMVSKALAGELASKGIRVNTVSPAFTNTNQTKMARDAASKEKGNLMWTAPPMGRIGEADEVSPAVIYLLSDASSYVTGADILVTGGIHTGRGGDYDTA